MVSIITPNYNCEKFISKTIQSVLNQTYSDWELIIVDDCSTDNSCNIALMYSEKDSRIKVFRNQKNRGAAFCRNVAIDNAKGEYLAFLDSDDLWEKDKLEKQLKFMKEFNCDFCFSEYDLIDVNDIPMGKIAKVVKHLSYWKYLHHCYTGCLTVIYLKSIASEARSFEIKNNNDYGLFIQIVRKAKNAMGMDDVLAHYRIHSNGISRKKFRKVKPYFQLMHSYLHFPYFLCCWFLFTNILIGRFKYHK